LPVITLWLVHAQRSEGIGWAFVHAAGTSLVAAQKSKQRSKQRSKQQDLLHLVQMFKKATPVWGGFLICAKVKRYEILFIWFIQKPYPSLRWVHVIKPTMTLP
jgi:hypothetical protein